MKYSVKFYPEKRKGVSENLPINMSVVYAGQRMFFYTGKRCHADQWATNAKDKFGNKKTQLKKNQVPINGQNAQEFMADLDRIKVAVDDLFKIYDVKKVVPTTDELREDLKVMLGKKTKNSDQENFFELFENYKNKAGRALGSIGNVRKCLDRLKKYDPDVNFEKINLDYIDGFYKNLIATISKNTAIGTLTIFKGFLKYCVKNKKLAHNPFDGFKIEQRVYGDPVYLTLEERDLIFNAEINNHSLSIVRDMFVLQSCLGCRFSDLIKLRKSSIVGDAIEYIAGKTKDHNLIVARVPLTKKAKSIIDKYDIADGRLMPFKCSSLYNRHIKKILIEVGITRTVIIPDKKTRETKQVRICDIATTHMARRIFIGGLIKKNVLIPVISSMSGHCEGSKAFYRYFHIDHEDQKSAMALIE